ncbi:hypothetical protein TSOC_009317, partial [Tetrabaena socialis]
AFPNTTVAAKNGCKAATPSSYMVMCLDLSVAPNVDLVLVEYNVNDQFYDSILQNPSAKDLERLLRRILALPGRPAVVLVQVPRQENTTLPYHFSSEDVEGALAHYYDLSYLSLRAALYPLATLKRDVRFPWDHMIVEDGHLGNSGHRMVADMIVYLLQEAYLAMLIEQHEFDDKDGDMRELPPPMYTGTTKLPPL